MKCKIKVLCVKEAPDCINSYKIVHTVKSSVDQSTSDIDENAIHTFHIHGKQDCHFPSIAAILEFYATHYLNHSPLIQPAFHHKKVIAMFDFQEGGDPDEDLYFKKNDILTVIEYTQGEHWWNASLNGKVGLIPATLVRRLRPNEVVEERSEVIADNKVDKEVEAEKVETVEEEAMQCPFTAKVIEVRFDH